MAQPREKSPDPLSSQAAGDGSSLDAEFVPLPTHQAFGGWTWRGLGNAALIGVAIIFAAALTFTMRGRQPAVWIAVLIAAVMVGSFTTVRVIIWILARRRIRRFLAAHDAPWSTAVAERVRDAPHNRYRSEVERWWATLLDRSDRHRAIVDERFRDALLAIPRTDELLEPETLNESDVRARARVIVFSWLTVSSAMNSRLGDWWQSALFGSLALWSVLTLPAVRDRIPALRDLGWNVAVVGQGWIRDRTRTWTADDSIALFFASPVGRRRRQGVVVRLIGPDGVRDLSFESVTNRDLALFWERWMHPRPRPELA